MPKKRTYADRREYLIMAVARRRKQLRKKAVTYKGGKCVLCGYSRCQAALDFHHLDASKKEFGISMDGITRSWERVTKELDKCVLVCSNCHREIHAGILQLSEVIQSEKWGEFREALNGNPEPSLVNDIEVTKKGAETRSEESNQ